MSKYFALTSDEKLATIEAESLGDALEKEPDNTVWLFDEARVAELGGKISEALHAKRLFAVRLFEPGEDDRLFVVAAADRGGAYGAAVDRSIGEVCSVTFVELDQILAEYGGCLEVLG
jgi:hypothetical protein